MKTPKQPKIITGLTLSGWLLTCAGSVYALPSDDSCNCTGVNYGVVDDINGDPTVGQFSVFQGNSIASFDENVSSLANESFFVEGTASNQVLLIRDLSGNPSQLNGSFDGDGNVTVFFQNQNGVIFGNGATINLPGLVATTYGVTEVAGQYQLDASSSVDGITVEGLSGTGDVALVSDSIDINGNVDLAGNFSAMAMGGTLVASLNNGLVQFEFDNSEALATSSDETLINVTVDGNIVANNITMQSWVSDPATFAINNQGVLTATGIDINSQGAIRLTGTGGEVQSIGTLDASDPVNGDGEIALHGAVVDVAGTLDAGSGELSFVIGDSGSEVDNAATLGRLQVRNDTVMTASQATIQGLGGVNSVQGFANYQVTADNSGTAAYQGVGSADWNNVGVVTFSDIAILFARDDISNQIVVADGSSLLQSFNGNPVGWIFGGSQDDTIVIEGEVEFIDGQGGNDLFIVDGGRVNTLIDGGADIDSIVGVFNAATGLVPGTGSATGINEWVNIENVTESVIPENIIAPQLSFLDISGLGSASLGLVGADADPNLPCGYGSNIPTAEEKSAALEEDCYNQYGGPEYQALISSLIHFDNDSSQITAASADRLNRVSNFFVESGLFDKVVIAAHTDDNASEAYNIGLSERRAQSTSRYMQGQGVQPQAIETYHFGESLPARPNTSDENRAYNRRAHIELKH